jgi:hypothetical protein
VAELFIPLLMVLMAADKMAAMINPSNPLGTSFRIKKGNTRSP